MSNDDFFQLNLDGQQITQKLASSGFGQPAFSRDAIAEFQIATNSFDITQGRSAGIQVNAVSKSGTNTIAGSFYGFFCNNVFNAPDQVSHTVLPFSDQQIGGTLGGPVIKDKLHYFVSYEYERNPGTIFTSPVGLGGEAFTLPTNTTQKSLQAHVDAVLSPKDQLSVRASRWNSTNRFNLSGGSYPSVANALDKYATNILGTWSRVIGGNVVQQVRCGYDDFYFGQTALSSVAGTPEFDFPGGLTIGAPCYLPSIEWQRELESRYELTWHRHDVKVGGEYLHVAHGFAYQVAPSFVIRGGSGLYYSTPYSNLSYSQQVFSETITGTFAPSSSGLCQNGSLFITNPRVGDLWGHGAPARAVAPNNQPGLQESLYLAKQHRLPEANGRRDLR